MDSKRRSYHRPCWSFVCCHIGVEVVVSIVVLLAMREGGKILVIILSSFLGYERDDPGISLVWMELWFWWLSDKSWWGDQRHLNSYWSLLLWWHVHMCIHLQVQWSQIHYDSYWTLPEDDLCSQRRARKPSTLDATKEGAVIAWIVFIIGSIFDVQQLLLSPSKLSER